MSKETDRYITFTDECGNEVTFILLDLISYKEDEFIVLIPPNENEVIILRIDDEGEEEAYVSVEDDELLEQLFLIFKEQNEDDYNFID